MFKCKVCIEKDLRIADLVEQVAYFKSVLHPKPRATQAREDVNETLILHGGGEEEVDLEAQAIENLRIKQEEDMIFSGNSEASA